METTDLIASLAAGVTPVRRLRPPLVRAATWLLLSAIVMSALCFAKGLRPDFVTRFADPLFAINVISITATGVLAAISAFMLSVPDRSDRWILLPVPALVVWTGNVGYQCLADWIPVPAGAVTPHAAASCFTTLALAGLPLSVTLITMLRHALVFRALPVGVAASLAVAGITASILAMIHPLDATAMVLGWNLAIGLLFVSLGLMMTRRKLHRFHSSRLR